MHSGNSLVIGGGVAISLASNALFGSKIGSVSRERELPFTPKGGAFSIWLFIYTLLIAAAVYAANKEVPTSLSYSLGLSLLLSAVWVPLFTRNSPVTTVASALVLWLSLVSAFVAVLRAGRFNASDPWRALGLQSSVALYAGWLCCAATLCTGIALDAYRVVLPPYTLFALSSLASVLAVISKNPVMAVPALWALAWQKQLSINLLPGAVVLITGAIASQL